MHSHSKCRYLAAVFNLRQWSSHTLEAYGIVRLRVDLVSEAVSHEQHARLRVVSVEAVSDDRHGEPGEQHPGEGAHDGEHSTLHRHRDNVSVADRRHRDERPVRAGRHVGHGGRRRDLAEVHGDAEHHSADDHQEDEEEHLQCTRPQRHDQNPQSDVVLAELQRPQYSEDVERREDTVSDV